jgi:hypothetical protein
LEQKKVHNNKKRTELRHVRFNRKTIILELKLFFKGINLSDYKKSEKEKLEVEKEERRVKSALETKKFHKEIYRTKINKRKLNREIYLNTAGLTEEAAKLLEKIESNRLSKYWLATRKKTIIHKKLLIVELKNHMSL